MSALRNPDRLGRLHAAMDRAEIDVAAIVPGPNFYFLTGGAFPPDGAPHDIVRVAGRAASRDHARCWNGRAGSVSRPRRTRLYWQDADGFEAAFRQLAARIAPARIGVEGQRMRFFEAEAIRPRLPGLQRASTRTPPSPTCACTRTRPRSPPCASAIEISEAALAAHARAGRRRHERDRVPAAPRRGDARRRGRRAGLRADRARRGGVRRPARHPQPRPPAGERPAAARRLRRRLGRLHGRHHPHLLRRLRQPRAPRHLRGGARRQRARPHHRRAADDAGHPRPPRDRKPARRWLRRPRPAPRPATASASTSTRRRR